jgi:hypothetical protein
LDEGDREGVIRQGKPDFAAIGKWFFESRGPMVAASFTVFGKPALTLPAD